MGAFFIALSSCVVVQACPAPGATHSLTVARVVDGDTLRLSDGRSLRLIGINAPELSPRGRSGPEPFGLAARERLQQLVAASGGRVSIYPAKPEKDRYGRSLVHLFDSGGRNIEAQLLADGLGYFVAFTPASVIAPCQRASEMAARASMLGIWKGRTALSAAELRESGFALVRGRITSLEHNAGGVWIGIDNSLVLRVAPVNREVFASTLAAATQGRAVEVRGWVVERRGRQGSSLQRRQRWMLTLSDPLMLEWLD